MDSQELAKKKAKILKRLKKAEFDKKHGRKGGEHRVRLHEKKLIEHSFKNE